MDTFVFSQCEKDSGVNSTGLESRVNAHDVVRLGYGM